MQDELELDALIIEARELVEELKVVLGESKDASTIVRYKRALEALRCDNERLYRENIMLRSALDRH